MEKKINIAELLKDCPSGMELDCMMYDNLYFDGVDTIGDIKCYIKSKDGCLTSITFHENGCYNTISNAKCVIFPKGKTTWEGFVPPCQFKDGDIVFSGADLISIFKGIKDGMSGSLHSYVTLQNGWNLEIDNSCWTLKNIRLATEEEKQKLFDAIKANGYDWNPETKTLKWDAERKVLDPKFKDGDVIFKGNFITIVSHIESSGRIWYHCWYNTKYKDCKFKNDFGIGDINDSDEVRFATEEEKQKLFDAIKANGYHWNAETKTLEKLPKFKVGNKVKLKGGDEFGIITQVADCFYTIKNKNHTHCWPIKKQDDWELVPNKFDISTLKPFESRVLVRDTDHYGWEGAVFGRYDGNTFFTIGGIDWKYCIPYEGNEHLYGTTNDCDNFFKTWEK